MDEKTLPNTKQHSAQQSAAPESQNTSLSIPEKAADEPVDSFLQDFPEGGFRAWATMAGS